MGEAKRKKLANASKLDPQLVPSHEREVMAEAMHRVVGAITKFHGADCIVYAQIGAEILRSHGFAAEKAAGAAAWRVGPGDGDVIAHAGLSAEIGLPVGAGQCAAFHAWIEVGDTIIDFTTHSLGDKACMLDRMDGGTTLVEWSPSYLWIERAHSKTHRAVATAASAGAFSYARNPRIEEFVFSGALSDEDVEYLAGTVEAAMQLLRTGQQLRVVGLGGDGHQDEQSARILSQTRGMARADVPRG